MLTILRYTKNINHQIAITKRAVDSNKNSLTKQQKIKLSFQDWLLYQGFKVYSESGIQTS
jgi:hypothetical protein